MLAIIIGLLSQTFFTARILIQWIKSERNRKIESPTLFWVFSMAGSILLFVYGWMRDDFSIVFGEFISFYIYWWNLKTKGVYDLCVRRVPASALLFWLLLCMPLVLLVYVGLHAESLSVKFLSNEDVPLYALIWGSVGQFVYKMRFVHQWFYSKRHHQSCLPVSFWWISVAGSAMIIVYAIFRHDFILLLGQFGVVACVRNIIIGYHESARQ